MNKKYLVAVEEGKIHCAHELCANRIEELFILINNTIEISGKKMWKICKV